MTKPGAVIGLLLALSLAACGSDDPSTADAPSTADTSVGSADSAETTAPEDEVTEVDAENGEASVATSPIDKWIRGMASCLEDKGVEVEIFKDTTPAQIGVRPTARTGADLDLREAYFEAYSVCEGEYGAAPQASQADYDAFQP